MRWSFVGGAAHQHAMTSTTPPVRRIALVGCTKGKLPARAPARDLYVGDLFAKARAYAQTFDAWYVLSARHGLVLPDEVIEPYDVTLGDKRRDRRSTRGPARSCSAWSPSSPDT